MGIKSKYGGGRKSVSSAKSKVTKKVAPKTKVRTKYSTSTASSSEYRVSDAFASSMPKYVQGVSYVTNDNKLIIDIRYRNSSEYDKIVNILDSKISKNLNISYGNEGNITMTYKNWNKRRSSNKNLTLVFATGNKKSIDLKVPGTNSKLENPVTGTTSS